MKLHYQIFISMIVGLFSGYFINPDTTLYSIIILFGIIFIKLLKMITIPLIFTSIISGLTNISNFNKLGRIGIKTITYYLMTSFFAIIIGLGLTNYLKPGDSFTHSEVTNVYDYSNLNTPDSALDIFVRMIPNNPISAAAEGDMLAVIFFAILFGISIIKLPNLHREKLSSFFDSLFQSIMLLTQMIIKLSPIGVFGLIVKTASASNFDLFYSIGKYMLTISIGLSIHIFLVLPLLFYIITNINPMKHFKAMSAAMATAFSTSSSSSTLPVTIKCVNENVKTSKEVSGFVLPMGATINMDGTALYECAGVIFISQILGVDLTFTQQVIVVLTALLASIGAAGIPSAGLVMIFIVTQAVGFNNEDVALIIGAMLAVDRPLDMFRTMVNVTSDSFGSAIIAHTEGDKLYK